MYCYSNHRCILHYAKGAGIGSPRLSKTEFACTAHAACEENNFVLDNKVTPGNVHDSKVFDAVYDAVTTRFPQVETVTVDA